VSPRRILFIFIFLMSKIESQLSVLRIGVIHGHQIVPWGDHHAISAVRRKLDADILIFGHTHRYVCFVILFTEVTTCPYLLTISTNRCEITQHDGHFHINPGSITGSFSPMQDVVIPSFILLAVQGSNVVCYVYELINGELEVSKTEFSKDDNQVEQS
jgi:vacuolar protein sorting-associated protein 29